MRRIIFGIRKSKLARAQLEEFIEHLKKNKVNVNYEAVTITTQGDKDTCAPIDKIGQGIFVKEIEAALSKKEIDCAVHSLKDVPVKIKRGTSLSCFVTRDDIRDCLVMREGVSCDKLNGLSVGTGSPRRTLFLKEIEPEVKTLPLRGNVDTRLSKLDKGDYDGIMLAACGLKRLGYENRITRYFEPETFVPPAGQGIVCAQTRLDDKELNDVFLACSDAETRGAAFHERKVLEALGIGCQTPFGVYARFHGNEFVITAKLYSERKHTYIYKECKGLKSESDKLVAELIENMRSSSVIARSEPLK